MWLSSKAPNSAVCTGYGKLVTPSGWNTNDYFQFSQKSDKNNIYAASSLKKKIIAPESF